MLRGASIHSLLLSVSLGCNAANIQSDCNLYIILCGEIMVPIPFPLRNSSAEKIEYLGIVDAIGIHGCALSLKRKELACKKRREVVSDLMFTSMNRAAWQPSNCDVESQECQGLAIRINGMRRK
jgi:hypothetical protein